jgi:predicted acetyltransferase
MAYRVRACRTPEEYGQAVAAIGHYFGLVPAEEQVERWVTLLPLERMYAAFDGSSIVGGTGSFDFEMTVPGGVVPCAGVTAVGVLPSHRRRGLLSRMMRAQLDDIRERGVPIAALYASEETIYGRYGYGLASLRHDVRLTGDRRQLRPGIPPRDGSVRLVDEDEASRAFPRLYERVRRSTPGFFARSREWWVSRRLSDLPETRGDAGPLNFALVEIDGTPHAYALYRISQREEESGWRRRIRVIEALGIDEIGTREIWRFLLEIDWVHELRASLLPVDHPLLHLVARPDSLNLRTETGLWVRIVDVGAALPARNYATGGRVTFEVADAFGPWNEGTWTLDEGRARRSRRRPDLRLDVTALGAVYLGGFSFRRLAAAGLVEEVARGGLRRADALFAPTGPAPWCAEIF